MIPRHVHMILACGLALTSGSAAVAQQQAQLPAKPQASQLHSIIGRSIGMDFVDGALRAGGPKYKAVLDQTGVSYTPALGSTATRNYPLQFTLQAIRRGGVTIYDAANAAVVQPQHEGLIASFARGNGIVESYEARIEGLKQNFTFAQQPAGEGNLIVEGRITTDLVTSQRGRHDAGLSFSAEGLGGVTIGEVIGIDEGGNRVGGSLSFDGTTVQFVLPGSFVDQAAYPLVLDPFIGSFFTVDSNGARDPDVAFDETFDDYLVVWEHEFSQADIDVRGQKFDLTGNLVATMIFVTNESGNEINPAVANVDSGSDYFVAYQDGASIFGPWDIRGRRVDGGTVTSLSSILDIAATNDNEITPDVSGDNSTISGTDNDVIVVFDDGTGITAVKVDVATATIIAGPITIDSSASATNPAISKSGGAPGRHMIVWEQQFSPDKDLQGALVDRNLNVLDSLVSVAGGIPNNEFNADVDGDGTSFLVVYQETESGQTGPSDIYCRRFEWTGSSLNASGTQVVVEATPSADERDPAIGFLGLKYVAAWADQSFGLDYDVVAIELDPATCLSCGMRQTSQGGPSNVVDINVEIATRYQGRASNNPVSADQGMIVWMDAQESPPFDSDIVATYYEAFGGGAVTNLGGGCGNGGTNGFNGPLALGNTTFQLTVSGAGSDLLLVSIMFVDSTATCGPCSINSDTASYFFAPGSGGSSSYALPISCNTGLLGLELYTQWAALVSGVNPCALIPPSLGISWSNRLSATITP